MLVPRQGKEPGPGSYLIPCKKTVRIRSVTARLNSASNVVEKQHLCLAKGSLKNGDVSDSVD
jgi:hypothetical protein